MIHPKEAAASVITSNRSNFQYIEEQWGIRQIRIEYPNVLSCIRGIRFVLYRQQPHGQHSLSEIIKKSTNIFSCLFQSTDHINNRAVYSINGRFLIWLIGGHFSTLFKRPRVVIKIIFWLMSKRTYVVSINHSSMICWWD